MPPPESLIFVLFLILFLGIWCFVLKIISCFGWGKMTKRYSAFAKEEGTSYHSQSMRLGRLANYNGCITFHVSKNGLHIAVFPFLHLPTLPFIFRGPRFASAKRSAGSLGKHTFRIKEHPRSGRMAINAKMHQAILREI